MKLRAETEALTGSPEKISVGVTEQVEEGGTSWPTPPLQGLPPQALWRARPVAVEITLTLKDQGVLTRIVEVAG